MIDQDEIENAVDFLRDNAVEAAEATAQRVYLQEFRKAKKAILRREFKADNPRATEGQCDDYAYSHPDYQEVLDGLKDATFKENRLRFLRDAAEAKISAYQTQCKMSLGIRV